MIKGKQKKAAKAKKRMQDAFADYAAARERFASGNCIEVIAKDFPLTVTVDELGF